MYIKLNTNEFEKVQKASEITGTDYKLLGNLMPVENMISVIENLLLEIDLLQEKYEDLEGNLEVNYKAIPVAEQYGISEREFV